MHDVLPAMPVCCHAYAYARRSWLARFCAAGLGRDGSIQAIRSSLEIDSSQLCGVLRQRAAPITHGVDRQTAGLQGYYRDRTLPRPRLMRRRRPSRIRIEPTVGYPQRTHA
jgi:hypothetical protein